MLRWCRQCCKGYLVLRITNNVVVVYALLSMVGNVAGRKRCCDERNCGRGRVEGIEMRYKRQTETVDGTGCREYIHKPLCVDIEMEIKSLNCVRLFRDCL